MSVYSLSKLKEMIQELAEKLAQDQEPTSDFYLYFSQEPDAVLAIVTLLESLEDKDIEEECSYYAACVYALDICVAQLQGAYEAGSKLADKMLQELMGALAQAIARQRHSLSFWLPILNAFYEVHVELSPELKNAYFNLALNEDDQTPVEEAAHLNAIRDLIQELSDLSIFDATENFFAQSYAMPPDFFADLVFDLYSIEEGQDIALLTLLHPKAEVREIVVAVHEQIINQITLSSISLTRLQAIKYWYPASYYEQIERWIKLQRKKGVVFQHEKTQIDFALKATEVDGSGAQGIFIHLKKKRTHRLGGLLFKQGVGIKDAWLTPVISRNDIKRYYDEAFDDSVMLRNIDINYLIMMTNHFLAETIEQGHIPDLHLLELQEELGLHVRPEKIEIEALLQEMAIQVQPFTTESMHLSLERSKSWPQYKRFTESWFIENPHVDKLVNHYCSIVDGVKVCHFSEAMEALFKEELETNREHWLFHFLWIALWLQSRARKNEKVWQDSFFIAYAIDTGLAMDAIPIMHEICYQSVVNSVETMQDRRTHLSSP